MKLFERMSLIDFLKKLKPADEPVDISNLTPRAQQALLLARQEAIRLRQNFVESEHVLLGLIKLGQGVAVKVIGNLGLKLEIVRADVEKVARGKADEKRTSNPPCAPGTRRIFEMAKDEARALHHAYIGTEHILLALLREKEGMAADIFKKFQLDVEQTHREILQELTPQ